MKHRISFAMSALALISLSNCSDQAVEAGTNPNLASDGGADGNGVIVEVSYEAQSISIDLGTMATSAYKGVNLVKLSDVWAGTGIASDRSTLEFEFVSSDGFKPSMKDCADLSGSLLDKAYINPTSRNLTWDESLGFEGCYSVRDVVEMNAHAPASDGTPGPDDASAE